MEDSRIVELYWERNERAISETASRYGTYCHAIAYNILCDHGDAEESVNDAYLGAWNAMPPHRPSVLRTFLGKITRRISLKKWRDRHRDKRGGGQVARHGTSGFPLPLLVSGLHRNNQPKLLF